MSAKLTEGQKFELEVFGVCSNKEGSSKKYPYRKFKKCMVQCMISLKRKRWKAKSPPENLLITKLLNKIREILQERSLPYTVKIYPTVGTQLDYVHGVDGVFTAKPLEDVAKTSEKVAFIPIDISLFPFKKHKMDVIVLNRSSFEEKITETAELIIASIHKQLY